jgi:hypothetical protein
MTISDIFPPERQLCATNGSAMQPNATQRTKIAQTRG